MNLLLIVLYGLLIFFAWNIHKESNSLSQKSAELNDKERELSVRQHEFLKSVEKLKEDQEILSNDRKLLDAKISDIPVLAKHFADIRNSENDSLVSYLLSKSRHAYRAAEVVKACNQEKYELEARVKELEYRCLLYESIDPVLSELEESESISSLSTEISIDDLNDSIDRAKLYLSDEEYNNLSSVEKYQLALDRWWNRPKSRAEVGADYERYIGYLMEKDGWTVSYTGIELGLKDQGIDLVCKKHARYILIQCKNWSSKKTIHEKHINQLFGTTVDFYLSKVDKNGSFSKFHNQLSRKGIIPLFVTSTTISDTAHLVAQTLGVEIRENVKFEHYPVIKCNINRSTKEKIYHLPFDQQYDRTKIDDVGEFYALTVKEAEDAGFRRAQRHFF